MVQGFPAKKLLIVQGPIGIGKSSELTRLAERFQQTSAQVIWLRLPQQTAKAALNMLSPFFKKKASIAWNCVVRHRLRSGCD
jgi:thymidylate kinase